MQLDFFFQYGVVSALVTLAAITSQSAGRDLRPSDHGLAYQGNTSPPTQNSDGSFFGSTTPSSPTLPEAQSTAGGERSRDVRGDLTRMVLLVASAICGVAGVVLLVVSAVVFIVRRRKHRAELAERLAPDFELHTVNDK
ncbi:hypothetical protein ABFS82_08G126000 [Erythranthe guttata]|uniref:uncharacterized protein LOC105951587 n=1 Tax=Erythranthe guttata TaxID=4155 RepID=UPI00064D9D47|nr:PREDICTED: uncharacterized protein LOC105951587 [Erythranthe guttata]|eukprot:XP_012830496.1 PREDICTED: uncharacterized protein LOC105951587 [Erythranthe guttata]